MIDPTMVAQATEKLATAVNNAANAAGIQAAAINNAANAAGVHAAAINQGLKAAAMNTANTASNSAAMHGLSVGAAKTATTAGVGAAHWLFPTFGLLSLAGIIAWEFWKGSKEAEAIKSS
ncbi:MAG: hypothetical protein HQK77_11585 [Desulfobacterales bacterium]|nr:hypothetical protein [Desulfobacterales bacterium]